jgi:hypothetical protein
MSSAPNINRTNFANQRFFYKIYPRHFLVRPVVDIASPCEEKVFMKYKVRVFDGTWWVEKYLEF